MNSRHATGQILPALAAHNKPGVDNHVTEVALAGEALDALDEVLVAVAVAGDELADEGDGAEGPALVEGVEEGEAVGLGELEAGEDAAGLEDAVGLAQGGGDVAEVADAKGDRVQVLGGRRDRRQVLGVGDEEGERGLLGRGQLRRAALLADAEHRRVDVGHGHAHVGVGVQHVGVVQHAEGDVACAAGYVEDVLGCGRVGGGETRRKRGDEVVSAKKEEVNIWCICVCPSAEVVEELELTSIYDATRTT